MKILQGTLYCSMLLWAGACLAQNIAQNPGFETGNTSGWFPMGGSMISAQTGVAHSGTYSAIVQDRTANWHGIAQGFQGIMQPGLTYNISAWVRMAGGDSETLQLTLKKIDTGSTNYTVLASAVVSAGGWTQLTGQYTLTVSGTLNELSLYAEVPSSATASFYLDDLVVDPVTSGETGTDGESTIHWDGVHQRIDGFGASSAWRGNWSTALADMFFSTNSGTGMAGDGSNYPYTGIGLSLLRTRIAPGGTTVEQSIMQMAQARGARVWSAPWSPAPAAQFKSNGDVNGGSFIGNAANYQAYANQMAGYVANMQSQYGVDLYAISIQNEPDANVTTYESCNWTAQQIHDFIPYLSSAMTASNVGSTKIMLPESQNWTDPQNLHLTAMNDPSVASQVGIIANHNYVPDNNVGDQTIPAAIESYGKALWETEVSLLSGSNSSIDNGLYWAGRVHFFLTAAQANAWHYWWLCAYGTGNEGLCDDNDVPAKRMYTVGNFSRFVRPGYHRVGTTDSGSSLVSAYKDLTNGMFSIVAINSATNAVTQTFNLTGFTAGSVTPWITSASLSIADQSIVTLTNSTFAYSLPAMSVVTFVGQANANTAPTLSPIADQVANAGVVLTVTNSATDDEVPPQTLAYTVLASPTNATLNATNGILTWRPLVIQAGTTNQFVVTVADDGSPSLSATNTFNVTVNPLAQPAFSSISTTGNDIHLEISGDAGPDYTLLTSTNMTDWQVLLVTNPLALPFSLLDTNLDDVQRFYQLQLGP